jgi:folate-dependent phosphoribosylglycinamide formyltransferase PurN
MKVVCLIGGRPQHLAFVNRVHRQHPVALAIIEAKQWSGLAGVRNRARNRLVTGSAPGRVPTKVRSRTEAAVYERCFGEDWRDLDPDVPVMWASDINGPDVVQRLADLSPDVLLDHGTAIVKQAVTRTTPMALNLHWGLSPYYRGTYCTDWALLHHDPRNIGVTVHRLAARIDAGDILGQARAAIAGDDDVLSINMQLTSLGIPLVLRALDVLAGGGELHFAPQDLTRGYLTLNRQWSGDLKRHVRRLIEDGGLARMLQKPARREQLPIVAWAGDDAPAEHPADPPSLA